MFLQPLVTNFSCMPLTTASMLSANCSAVKFDNATRTEVVVDGERWTRAHDRAFSISCAACNGVITDFDSLDLADLMVFPDTSLGFLGCKSIGTGRFGLSKKILPSNRGSMVMILSSARKI